MNEHRKHFRTASVVPRLVALALLATSLVACEATDTETADQQPAGPEVAASQAVDGAADGDEAPGDPCDGLPGNRPFVVATTPVAGAVVSSPFEVSGCSRTFESTIVWKLLARDGSTVADGHTMGGGVDGPGPFRFTIEIEGEGEASGLHHLYVEEPLVSEEGFPPAKTVLPLVLAPADF